MTRQKQHMTNRFDTTSSLKVKQPKNLQLPKLTDAYIVVALLRGQLKLVLRKAQNTNYVTEDRKSSSVL